MELVWSMRFVEDTSEGDLHDEQSTAPPTIQGGHGMLSKYFESHLRLQDVVVEKSKMSSASSFLTVLRSKNEISAARDVMKRECPSQKPLPLRPTA